MARREALLRLRRTLLERYRKLCLQLTAELSNLHDFRAADSPGDSVDGAFETSNDEMSYKLAELDARELSQIESAVDCVRRGTYGLCEGGSENCQKRIPLARLNALPHTTLCIICERHMEKHPDWQDRRGRGYLDPIFNPDVFMEDQRVTLSGLEMNLCGKR